jgi:hypothetical protein
LLVLASRKKGDYVPGLVIRFLGSRLAVSAIFTLYLGLIFFYGVFIYENLVERLLTITVGVLTAIATWRMIRGGAFHPRLVFELCDDQRPGGKTQFNVVGDGQVVSTPISLNFRDDCVQEIPPNVPFNELHTIRAASLQISREIEHIREIKVWSHQVRPEGESVGIPSTVQIDNHHQEHEQQTDLPEGLGLLPLPSGASKVQIGL